MSKCFSLIKHTFMAITVMFALTSTAWAATYYVDPSGNDANSGTSTSPKKTVSAAAGLAKSGDVVHVNAGSYTETSQINLVPGATLEGVGPTSVIVAGFAANPLIAMQSSTQGTDGLNQEVRSLKLDGNTLTGVTAVGITRRSNVVVHDCTFVNFGQTGLTINGGADDSSEPTTYATGIKVYNSTLTNCSVLMGAAWISGSVYMRGLQGARIYNNTITETSRGSNSGGCIVFFNNGWFKDLGIYGNTLTAIENYDSSHFAIELWNGKGQVEIYNNTITGNINLDTVSKGTYAYGLSVHNNLLKYDAQSTQFNKGICFDGNCSDIIISNNYIKNMHLGVYFYIRTGSLKISNVQINYNIFDGIGKVGDSGRAYYCDSADGTSTFTNLKVMNNVIYARYSTMDVGIGFKSCGVWSNFYAQNNIIVGSIGPAIKAWSGATGATLSNVYIQNNDYYANATNDFSNTLPATGVTNLNNKLGVNPLLVSSSDFHLQSTSPCIDAGINTGITQDYAGNPVPYGGGYDIGAAEYGSTASTTIAPPTNLQVN
jgi:hypothetical protein